MCTMGGAFDAHNDTDNMNFISNLDGAHPTTMTWSEIKNTTDKAYFYATKFNFKVTKAMVIADASIKFLNPANNKTLQFDHDYSLDDRTSNPRKVKGPVDIGPSNVNGNFGIALSNAIMTKLELKDNDVVYFNVE